MEGRGHRAGHSQGKDDEELIIDDIQREITELTY